MISQELGCAIWDVNAHPRVFTNLNNERLVQQLQNKLEQDPSNAQAYYELTDIYLEEYFFDDAIAQLRTINRIFPHDIFAYRYLALVLVSAPQTDYLGASLALEKAVEISPQRADLYIQLAWLHAKMEKWDSAKNLGKKALRLSTDNTEKAASYLMLSAVEPEKSQEYLRKALEVAPAVAGKKDDIKSVPLYVGDLPFLGIVAHPSWNSRLKHLDDVTRQ